MIARTAASGLLLLSVLSMLAACSGPEARATRYVERSEKYFAEKNYDKARIEANNALQIEPANVRARILAGRVAEKQIKPSDALANYQAAVDADPGSVEARASLGRIYLLGGLVDKAQAAIAPALVKAPGDPELLTVRGGIRAVQGDVSGALADAEIAVKGLPHDEIALALLASLYQRDGRSADAIALLQKSVQGCADCVDLRTILADLQLRSGQPAAAEEQLKLLADAHPRELAYWQQLARFYLLQKNLDGAEQAMQEAVKRNPDSIDAKNAYIALLASQRGAEAAQQKLLEFVKAEPRSEDLKIALGQFYEANGRQTEAETTYRAVIAEEGVKTQGLAARDRLAEMLVRKADLPGAEQLIKEVLAENPRDNDALVLRAGIALSRNQTAAAITDLRAVLRDQPKSQPLMRALARAHLQDHDTALAEEVLRNAVQSGPSDLQTRLDLADLLAHTGRPKLAQPMLEQLARDAPDNIPVREALFQVQGAQDDWSGADRTAEEIKRLRPDVPTGYLLAGSLREREQNFPAALKEYELAMRHASDPLQVLPRLVQVELRQKRPDSAESRLTAFLQKNSESAPAYELMGEVRMTQHDFTGATANFDRAIALQPKWWLPYRGKSVAQDASGHPDLALSVLQQGYATTAAPDLGVDLAALQDKLGHHDASIQIYEDLHKQQPESLPIANNLAMMLVNQRTDAASLAQADKLGELLASSSEPSYLDTRGWIKLRLGQVQEALPLLQQAVAKAPQSREILYHLGMAQYRSGDRGAARENLEAALAGDKSFAGADEARATLASLRGAG